MDNLYLIPLIIITLILVLILGFGFYRTYLTQTSPSQKIFLEGSVPKNLSGFYPGTVVTNKSYQGPVKTYTGSWKGKIFNSTDSAGINKMKDGEKYPFKTYTAKGIQDKNLDVLKIDYNIEGNPWWLRTILDELVEVGPNKYLGKVHIRLLPGLTFTVGYFKLEK